MTPAPIALFIENDGDLWGGVSRIFRTLAAGLADAGLRVDLVVNGRVASERRSAIPPNVALVELGASGLLGAFKPLVAYLRSARPGALVSAMDHPNALAAVAARFADPRPQVICTTHNPISVKLAEHYEWTNRLIVPVLLHTAHPLADAFVAPAEALAEDLVGCLPRRMAGRVHAIANPVVTTDLIERSQQAANHPWAERDREGVPLLVSAGRLTTQKDHSTLLRALARVLRVRNVRLLILGEGELRGGLESQARSLGIDRSVKFLGNVDNPLPLMRAADAFVLSSRWEGLPTVLIESLAVGTPAVSTDCPTGPAEILDRGRFGRLVKIGDDAAMAEAILATLSAPSSPESLIERSRLYGVERAVRSYLQLLDLAEYSQPPARHAADATWTGSP